MNMFDAPKFLGKICIVTGGSFTGRVCMPNEMQYYGGYEYGCITIDVKNTTVDIADGFAWVNEGDLKLYSDVTSLDNFKFCDSEDREDDDEE